MKRHHRSIMQSLMALALPVTLIACGGAGTTTSSETGSTGNGTGSAVTSLTSIPRATAPVVGSTSGNLALGKTAGSAGAVSGLKLKTLSSTSFSRSSELAMCEAANQFKQAFNEAVQGDMILCYIQTMIPDNSSVTVDVYDGKPHVFDLAFTDAGSSEEMGHPPEGLKVQIQITKDATSGEITDFKMRACEGSRGQTEYLHQALTDTTFSLESIFKWQAAAEGEGSGGQHMTVTGALNASNQFTSKTMTSEYTGNWGDGDGHGGTTVVQFPSQFTVSQWDTGTWKDGGDSALSRTYTHRVYGAAELLNADKVATIAIGDGAAFIIGSGTYAGGTYSYSEEAGWDADTTLPDPLSEFMDDVDAAQVPAVGGDVTIAFTGDAAFDCNTKADATVSMSESKANTSCEDLSLGWDWVNCWDIVENNQ